MEEPPGELTLTLTHLLAAPRLAAFRAFSTEQELARWWGPAGFSIPRIAFRARVGESYRIEMRPPVGEPFHLTGEFREVQPPQRLAYTFRWEDPDPDDVETLVELSFRDHGAATEVIMTQAPFRTEARRELHRIGWTESLAKLERLLPK